MEPLPEMYELETVAQMRAIADPLRLRLLDLLTRGALTVTQASRALDVPAPKMHYHMRELERVGLVRLSETRKRDGMAEKYYRAIARNFRFPRALFGSLSANEQVAATEGILQDIERGYLAAYAAMLRDVDPPPKRATLQGDQIWLTDEEAAGVLEQIRALLAPFTDAERSGASEVRARAFFALLFDAFVDADSPAERDDLTEIPHD